MTAQSQLCYDAIAMAELQIDWQAVQAAYFRANNYGQPEGVTWNALASQFGVKMDTLRRRAYRQGWPDLKAKAVQAVNHVIVKVEPKAEKPQSVALKERVAKQLERDLEECESSNAVGVKAAAERQQVVSAIVQNAKLVHGWGESQQSTLISLGMLSGDAMPAVAQQPVIDLASQSQEYGGDHKGETQDHVKPKFADSDAITSGST